MLGLMVLWVVMRGVLAIWLPQSYASAIAAFVWIPTFRILPGAKRISAAKTMLAAAACAMFVFATETLFAML